MRDEPNRLEYAIGHAIGYTIAWVETRPQVWGLRMKGVALSVRLFMMRLKSRWMDFRLWRRDRTIRRLSAQIEANRKKLSQQGKNVP